MPLVGGSVVACQRLKVSRCALSSARRRRARGAASRRRDHVLRLCAGRRRRSLADQFRRCRGSRRFLGGRSRSEVACGSIRHMPRTLHLGPRPRPFMRALQIRFTLLVHVHAPVSRTFSALLRSRPGKVVSPLPIKQEASRNGWRISETATLHVCEILLVMLREFDARLEKGDNPGAWTCVVMDDAVALFGTRGLVKIRRRGSTASRSTARS